MDRTPEPQLIAPGASGAEAAAIVAALEASRRARPAVSAVADEPSAWVRAALVEGVGRGQA